MELERGMELEDRLKSLISHLHTESGILDRLIYKNKNQHRRCPYFDPLLKVRRDLKLLQSAGLTEILSVMFPIIDGKKPAQKALLPKKQKKNNPKGKHNYQERLLGVARLPSQMVEPILNAAIQISFLLAKSFFTGFSLTTLALLARLRVLVHQILLDVVVVFNKVSSFSLKQHSVKLTRRNFDSFAEHDQNSEETPSENFTVDMQPIMSPSEGQSAKIGEGANAMDCQRLLETDATRLICCGSPSKFSDNIAFISAEKSISFDTHVGGVPNKRMKLDLLPTDTMIAGDPIVCSKNVGSWVA